MTREELVAAISRAIAEYEGFFARGSRRTLAQRNANPGCVRRWRDAAGRPYPTRSGYVDFVAWAARRWPDLPAQERRNRAEQEGWRVLRRLVGLYIDGAYTRGKPPTLREMMRVYAPASDGNDPDRYTSFVAGRAGINPDVPLHQIASL